MGCNIGRSHKITIHSIQSKVSTWKNNQCFCIKQNEKIKYQKEIIPQYYNKISKLNIIKILDYLSYDEIKEIGKINRKFNFIVQTNNMLFVKFFRRKSSIEDNKFNLKNFGSFSELQNVNTSYGLVSNI